MQVTLWFSFGFDVKGVQSTLNITSEKHQQLKRATGPCCAASDNLQIRVLSACPKCLLGRWNEIWGQLPSSVVGKHWLHLHRDLLGLSLSMPWGHQLIFINVASCQAYCVHNYQLTGWMNVFSGSLLFLLHKKQTCLCYSHLRTYITFYQIILWLLVTSQREVIFLMVLVVALHTYRTLSTHRTSPRVTTDVTLS